MVATLAITPLRPSQGALLPSIATAPADLTAANIALTSVRNVGLLIGPLLAGLILHAGGPSDVFAASTIGLAAAAILIGFVPTDPARSVAERGGFGHVMEGLRLLLREDRATLVVGLTFAKHIVMGALQAFLVIVALGLLGMGPGGPGVLSVALGIGGAVGAGSTVVLMGRRRLSPALMVGAILLGLPIAAIGARPGVALVCIALAVAGTGRSLIDIAGRTLLGRVAPEEAIARFLGMLEGSSYAGLAVGSGLAALLVHELGIRGALLCTGLFLPVLTLILWRPLRLVDRSPLVSRDRLELILGVPMFAPLPPESVERLAAQLKPIEIEPGTTLIRQGEAGDRFYILETGAADAWVDGMAVAAYGPGDSFGEIALLRDVPRTATVRATSASRVMALDRTNFLAVLTDEPKSLIAAEQVATVRIHDTASKRA
jgi:MFS family permease